MGEHAWPDYCKRETLAKRLNLAVGVIDQYVKRGILPPPILVGEALLWRWADVDRRLAGGNREILCFHRLPDISETKGESVNMECVAPISTLTVQLGVAGALAMGFAVGLWARGRM